MIKVDIEKSKRQIFGDGGSRKLEKREFRERKGET
jgi:hypothetical protein